MDMDGRESARYLRRQSSLILNKRMDAPPRLCGSSTVYPHSYLTVSILKKKKKKKKDYNP